MTNQTNDMLQFNEGEAPKLPSSLNVLTILTFIGCAVGAISSIFSFMTAEKSYKDIVANQDKMENAPAFVKKMMGPEMVEMARKAAENKMVILIIGLAGIALCLWGAIEMRKLKKQGFILWVAGEFLPIIATGIVLGFGIFAGFAAIGLLVPIVFLILYGVNRKHLVY